MADCNNIAVLIDPVDWPRPMPVYLAYSLHNQQWASVGSRPAGQEELIDEDSTRKR